MFFQKLKQQIERMKNVSSSFRKDGLKCKKDAQVNTKQLRKFNNKKVIIIAFLNIEINWQ